MAAARITPADDPSLLPAPVKLEVTGAAGVLMVTLAAAEALDCPNVHVFVAEALLELVDAVERGTTGLAEVEELALVDHPAQMKETEVVVELVVLDVVLEELHSAQLEGAGVEVVVAKLKLEVQITGVMDEELAVVVDDAHSPQLAVELVVTGTVELEVVHSDQVSMEEAEVELVVLIVVEALVQSFH